MVARFSASVQTGPGAHPAFCTIDGGSFPGVKRPVRGADPPPHLQCRGLKLGTAIPLPALRALVACYRENLYLYYYSTLKRKLETELTMNMFRYTGCRENGAKGMGRKFQREQNVKGENSLELIIIRTSKGTKKVHTNRDRWNTS